MRQDQSRSKRGKYQEVRAEDVPTDDEKTDQAVPIEPRVRSSKPASSDSKKQKTFIRWVFDKPWTKRPVFYFLIAIAASIANAVFYLMDHDTAFIIGGVLGIVVCVYGLRHFRRLLLLKARIDSFGSLNKKFRREQNRLNHEVDRIETANQNLRETHQRLSAATKRNRENLEVFRELEGNMDRLGKQSIAGLTELQTKCRNMGNKWHDELYNHQRNLLHRVFERIEHEHPGSRQGLNHQQFDQFQQELPEEYQARFARLGTFRALSKGRNVIDVEDFKKALDVFAEMAANDEDIEFEVKKTPKMKPKSGSNQQQGKPLYDREIVVTKRTQRSLRYDDIGLSVFDLEQKSSADHTDDDDDHEAAAESMFGARQKKATPKSQSKVTFKSMGRTKFADLLDSAD